MKRLYLSLVVFALFGQAVFAKGSTDVSAQPNHALPAMQASGIRLEAIAPNPVGSFVKLYAVRKSSGNADIPVELANGVAGDMDLTIFHFNDLHGHITDQHAKKGDTHRVAQMKRIVDTARKAANEREIVLFLSAGDEHTGTPFDELLGWNAKEFILDPAYRILSAAGLDASVVGNHEVDRGYELLAKAVSQDAAFPVLSANINGSKWATQNVLAPAVIGIAKGMRIGLIGLTTPEETREATSEDPDVRIGSPLEALDYYLPRMEAFVDAFVILDHLGFEGEERHRVNVGDRAIAEAAAKRTGKPVIIIGGHTHSILNKNGMESTAITSGVPIAQAGAYGAWLGRVSMQLRHKGTMLALAGTQASLLPIKNRDIRVATDQKGWADLEQDGDYDAAFEKTFVDPILSRLTEKMKEPLGKVPSTQELSSERILAERYQGESGMANYMNDMIVARSSQFPGGSVDLAVFNASGIASGVNGESTVTFGEWFKVMPYADNIMTMSLNGAQLLELVQSNAQRLVRPSELSGEKPIALDGFISRGFLHFSSGLRYEIVLGADAGQATVENVRVNGVDVRIDPSKTYRIAFSTYIANGFEGWKTGSVGAGLPEGIKAWNLAALEKHDTGLVYRNELIAGIKERGIIAPLSGKGGFKDGRVEVRH